MTKYDPLRITALYQLPGQERYHVEFTHYDLVLGWRIDVEEFVLTPAELHEAIIEWRAKRRVVGEAGAAMEERSA